MQDLLSLMPLQYCVHHVHAWDACMARTVLAAAPSAVPAGSSGPTLDQLFWLRVGNASPCVSPPRTSKKRIKVMMYTIHPYALGCQQPESKCIRVSAWPYVRTCRRIVDVMLVGRGSNPRASHIALLVNAYTHESTMLLGECIQV